MPDPIVPTQIPVPAPTPAAPSASAQPSSATSVAAPISGFCQYCGTAVSTDAVFCPHCGKQIKDDNTPPSVMAQIGVYALSLFLPPLGFWPGIKYVLKNNPAAKKVGWIAIALSIVSTIGTIWLSYYFLQIYLNTFSSVLGGGSGSGLGL